MPYQLHSAAYFNARAAETRAIGDLMTMGSFSWMQMQDVAKKYEQMAELITKLHGEKK